MQQQLKVAIANGTRWIAVLPASIIAALVAHALLRIAELISTTFEGHGWLTAFTTELICNAALGAGFVWGGAYVAPHHRRIVGYVLAATICTGVLWLRLKIGTYETWIEAVGDIATLLGAALVVFSEILDDLAHADQPISMRKSFVP